MKDPWHLVEKKRYKAALKAYTLLHKAEPSSKPHLGNRGIVHLLMGNYKSALSDFLLIFDTMDPRARSTHEHFFGGICLWHLNRPDEAVAAWQGALTAPYRDAAGGVEAPALLPYAALRLADPALRKDALRKLRDLWKKHLRRQARKKTKLTHTDLVHPGLPAWPGAIVPFLLGEMDETQLLNRAANTPSDILRSRWLCQAHFYVAINALANEDLTKFQAEMRQCAASPYGMLEHEYFLACWEVQRNFPTPAFPKC